MLGTYIYKPLQDNELPVYEDVRYEVEDPETHEKHVETHKELVRYEPNPAPNTLNKYSEAAHWCNSNDAHIEDCGEYYAVVANEHHIPTDEELAASARAQRDLLLKDCDWTDLPNARLTPEEKAQWAKYRDDLFNVPQQEGFPRNIVWPVSPKEVKNVK